MKPVIVVGASRYTRTFSVGLTFQVTKKEAAGGHHQQLGAHEYWVGELSPGIYSFNCQTCAVSDTIVFHPVPFNHWSIIPIPFVYYPVPT